jgi:hypothetical protein
MDTHQVHEIREKTGEYHNVADEKDRTRVVISGV